MTAEEIPGLRAFAVVCDVPASWEGRSTTAPAPNVHTPGLILHAAGPTDDGIRTIDIWESETAWNRHRALSDGGPTPRLTQRPVLRKLRVREFVHPEPDRFNEGQLEFPSTSTAVPRKESK